MDMNIVIAKNIQDKYTSYVRTEKREIRHPWTNNHEYKRIVNYCKLVKKGKRKREITHETNMNVLLTAMNRLKMGKNPGLMQLTAAFIKHTVDILTPVILDTFNAIIGTGIFPQNWKDFFLVPIPRKCADIDVKDFRGISILHSEDA